MSVSQMKEPNVLTRIKQQVDQQYNRVQPGCHSKINKYYTLYIDKIILIQRHFRNKIIKANKLNTKCIAIAIELNNTLAQQNQYLVQQYQNAKRLRRQCKEASVEQMVQKAKQQLNQEFKKVFRKTFDISEQHARNNAQIKVISRELMELDEQNGQLSGQLQMLLFQEHCYFKRKDDWTNKIAQLRNKIALETEKQMQFAKEDAVILQ